MGLDVVELLLAAEEEFGLDIPDADAEKMTTPRMLADYVISRVGNLADGKGYCLSQAGFYRIRSALVRQFGFARRDIRPDTRITDLLKNNIRKRWAALKLAVDATQLPGLKCKKSVAYPIQFGLPVAGVALVFLAGAPVWLWVLAAFVLWIVAFAITAQIGDVVPEHLKTIGALVPYVRVKNQQEWTRDYVLQKVMQLTAVQFGIPIEKIHPDDHFVKDLDMC